MGRERFFFFVCFFLFGPMLVIGKSELQSKGNSQWNYHWEREAGCYNKVASEEVSRVNLVKNISSGVSFKNFKDQYYVISKKFVFE